MSLKRLCPWGLGKDGEGEGLGNSQIIKMQMMMAIITLEKENKKLLDLFQSQARKRMQFLSCLVKGILCAAQPFGNVKI